MRTIPTDRSPTSPVSGLNSLAEFPTGIHQTPTWICVRAWRVGLRPRADRSLYCARRRVRLIGNNRSAETASCVAPRWESPATPHRPVSHRTTLEAGAKIGCLDVAKRRQTVHGHRSSRNAGPISIAPVLDARMTIRVHCIDIGIHAAQFRCQA